MVVKFGENERQYTVEGCLLVQQQNSVHKKETAGHPEQVGKCIYILH